MILKLCWYRSDEKERERERETVVLCLLLFQNCVAMGTSCLLSFLTRVAVVPSYECRAEDVEALLCRHAYPPCNVSSGATYPPLQEECQHVERACGDWWNPTRQSPEGYILPDCSSLSGMACYFITLAVMSFVFKAFRTCQNPTQFSVLSKEVK